MLGLNTNMNNYYNEEGIDYKEPWEYIEGEEENYNDNEYREASKHFLRIMTLCTSYIISQSDTLAAAYAVAFTLGLADVVDGKSMSEVCNDLNLSRATISNHCKNIRLLTGLPPSSLMLEIEKTQQYRETRLNQLQ